MNKLVVGTVTFISNQGIAHLAREFHRHGIIDRVMAVRHPHYANDETRFPNAYRPMESDKFLDGLDVLLLFETTLKTDVARAAVVKGIKIVVVPMYEYSPIPFPVPVDLFLCPSKLDWTIYSQMGLHCVFLPVPVDKPWTKRDRATRFVHNAGHGQHDYAKGTPQLIEAMKYVESPVKLTIRAQVEDGKMQALWNLHHGNPRIGWMIGNLPEDQLYSTDFDVFINAESLNGLSLPLQEAHASGMLVMTTDRFPANDWLPKAPLIPVQEYYDYRIPGGASLTFQRARVDPRMIARKIDEWFNQDIGDLSEMGRQWAEENSWERLKPQYLSVLGGLLK